jgi:DNA mismatch endonuclease, patch repair protein
MVDRVSKQKRSKIMSAIRSKNTLPEIFLRKALWAKGLRFRIQYGKEKIDIAFPSNKIAIFVDGCFWHGCTLHSHIPKSNKEYWIPKFQKNIERAKAKDMRLQNDEWEVLHFWEHELSQINETVNKIESAIDRKTAHSLS